MQSFLYQNQEILDYAELSNKVKQRLQNKQKAEGSKQHWYQSGKLNCKLDIA